MSQHSNSDEEQMHHNSETGLPQNDVLKSEDNDVSDEEQHTAVTNTTTQNASVLEGTVHARPADVDNKTTNHEITMQTIGEALQEMPFWQKVDPSVQKQIMDVVAQINGLPNTTAATFSAHWAKEWEVTWNQIPSWNRSDEQKTRDAWLAERCLFLVSVFVDEAISQAFAYEPELPISELNEEAQQQASLILEQVRREHVPKIEDKVNQAVAITIASMGAMAQGIEPAIRNNFLKKHLLSIIEEVLQQATSPDFEYQSCVDIDSLPDDQAKQRARDLISQVQPHHATPIAQRVEHLWSERLATIPKEMIEGLEQQLKTNFLKEDYFKIVELIVKDDPPTSEKANSKRNTSESQAKDAKASCSNLPDSSVPSIPSSLSRKAQLSARPSDTTSTSMFASPKKRQRTSARIADDVPAVIKTVADIHQGPDAASSEPLELQCYVLFAAETPKYINVTDRKTKASESTAVATLVLADRTGPILIDLWRVLAEETLRSIAARTNESDDLIIVNVHRCTATADNRTCIPRWRKLSTTSDTTITVLDNPTSSALLNVRLDISGHSYTRDFTKLTAKPKFLINLAGVVCDVENEKVSQSGVEMQEFKLVDAAGRWVQCITFGRHSGTNLLEEGNDVCLFFASAQSGLKGRPGSLWLYDESHIVKFRATENTPAIRLQMELKD